MSSSFTFSESQTFTLTHAKHIASKVATDLKRMQRFYNYPSDSSIISFETEVIELLKKGYLGTITYGFQKDAKWIEPALRYTAKELTEMTTTDDDPGRIRPGANIVGASFYSYLTYSSAWNKLTQFEKDAFKKDLPFQRGGAEEPGINGYLSNDKTYSSGGKALERSIVKSY
jgi:Bacterial HORMA domain family 1